MSSLSKSVDIMEDENKGQSSQRLIPSADSMVDGIHRETFADVSTEQEACGNEALSAPRNLTPSGDVGANLLSRDAMEKPRSGTSVYPGTLQGTSSERGVGDGLNQLEQDVLSKSASRVLANGATRSGEIAVSGVGEGLNRLEKDSISKSALRTVGTSDSRPGAVSVSGIGETLSRLEQDVMSKSLLRPKGHPTSRPGAVSVGGEVKNASSQIERDSEMKSILRPEKNPASEIRPVSVQDVGDILAHLDRDVREPTLMASNLRVGQSSTSGTESVRDISANSMSKSLAGTTSRPDAVSAGGNSRAVDQLEQDAITKSRIRRERSRQPGAVSVRATDSTPPSKSSLTQFEEDVVAKSSTRSPNSFMVQPGAVSVSRPGTALENLEETVLTKAKVRPVGGPAAQPGAVSVSSGDNSLKQVRDGASMESSMRSEKAVDFQPNPLQITGGTSLHQLEEDVRTKQALSPASPATRPGAVMIGRGGSTLHQLEDEVIRKSLAVDGAPDRVGSASISEVGNTLSHLEDEVARKSQLSKNSAVVPGAVSVSLPATDDALKAEFHASESTQESGTTSTLAGVSTLHQLEDDIASKTRERAYRHAAARCERTPAHTPSLSQMEAEVAAKSLSRNRGGAVAHPGAVSVSGASSLTQLEEEVAMKTRNQLVAPSPRGSRVDPSSSLRQLEEDVAAKSRAYSTGQSGAVADLVSPMQAGQAEFDGYREDSHLAGQNSLQQMEMLITEKARTASSVSFPGSVTSLSSVQRGKVSGRSAEESSTARSAAAFATLQSLEDEVTRRGRIDDGRLPGNDSRYQDRTNQQNDPRDDLSYDGRPELLPPTVRDDFQDSFASRGEGDGIENMESAVGINSSLRYDPETFGSSDPTTGQTSGIEAFVADTVVTATSAFVVSEEEEKEMERRRLRRYVCFGLVVFCLVAVVIVSVAVVLSGKKGNSSSTGIILSPTELPSSAPSQAPSSAPTTQALAATLDYLKAYYENQTYFMQVFQDTHSPQYQAALWRANEDIFPIKGVEDPKALQRFALATFYFATNGDGWGQCYRNDGGCGQSAWLSSNDECTWYGVQCRGDGIRVDQMYFAGSELAPGNDLRGTLPSEVAFLHNLSTFGLANNYISGPIPESWSRMSQFMSVQLAFNLITGTFPDFLVPNNPSLFVVDLGNNKISGTFPTTLGMTTSLRELRLGWNSFNGTIPSELGNASNLRTSTIAAAVFTFELF